MTDPAAAQAQPDLDLLARADFAADAAGRAVARTFSLALLLGVAADLFFHGRPAGLSVMLYVILYWSALAALLRERYARAPAFAHGLFLPIALLGLAFALFANPTLSFLNGWLLVGLLGLQSILLAGRSRWAWHQLPILAELLALPPLSIHDGAVALRVGLNGLPLNEDRRQTAVKVLAGIVLALPVLLVGFLLLRSADAVFASGAAWVGEQLAGLELQPAARHCLFILIVSGGALGLLWALTREPVAAAARTLAPPRFIDPVVIATMLALLNLLYLLFCAVQFAYLFSTGERALPAGFTYAEYARRGFYELCLVTGLNIACVLPGLFMVCPGGRRSSLLLRSLQTLLVAQSGVILASAFMRLSLYEAAYGYTATRLFARTMILLMAATLAMLAARVWLERFPFAKAFLLTALALYLGLNYFNGEAFIARRNIDRHLAGADLDLPYLQRLSHDAVPELMRLLDSPDPLIRQGVRDHLAQRRRALADGEAWVSWNRARQRARALLQNDVPHADPIQLQPTGDPS